MMAHEPTETPHGPAHLDCPQWQKPMSEVCHRCPWWTRVGGIDASTGAEVGKWNCAVAWGPTLALEVLQQTRHAAEASVSLRDGILSTTVEMQGPPAPPERPKPTLVRLTTESAT